jgi:single-stranded DNA-binding protein
VLFRSPEEKYSQSGKRYVRARFAAQAQRKDDPTTFYDIEVWGDYLCDKLIALRKGNPVIVCGEHDGTKWERDGKSGQNNRITAREIKLLEWADDGAAATPPPARNDAQRTSAPPPHRASTLDDDIPF